MARMFKSSRPRPAPYRKKSKFTTRPRKNKAARMNTTNVNQAPTTKLFPTIKPVIMKYNDSLAFNGTTNCLQVYAMNNLYDLDYSNGGGANAQPRGFDTLAGLYNKYVVYTATATVTAHSVDSTNGSFILGYPTLQPGPTLTAISNIKPLSEQVGARTVFLPPTGESRKIKIHFSCKNRFGIPLKEIKESASLYGAAINAAPQRVGYVNIVGYPGDLNLGTTATNIVYTVKIRCKCIFRQQVQDLSQ